MSNNKQLPGGQPFRAGFVAITGLPNVGKSTLLNALLGARLSIISPKPQTTRNNIKGILNTPGHQTVFVDTPGMLTPRNLFEKHMSGAIKRAASEDSDLALLVVEPRVPPADKLEFFEKFKFISAPLYLVVNKIDLCGKDAAEAVKTGEFFSGMLPVKKVFLVGALGGAGVKELKAGILAAMPEHPAYYPVDQMTDRWERFYAAEVIREQIMQSINFLKGLRAAQKQVRLKLYPDQPLLKLAIVGDYAFLRHYHTGQNVRHMPEYVFRNEQKHGGLYVPLNRYFLSRWQDPGIPEYDLDTDELVYRDRTGSEVRREQFGNIPISYGAGQGTEQ